MAMDIVWLPGTSPPILSARRFSAGEVVRVADRGGDHEWSVVMDFPGEVLRVRQRGDMVTLDVAYAADSRGFTPGMRESFTFGPCDRHQ
jgi:hypothetical protein